MTSTTTYSRLDYVSLIQELTDNFVCQLSYCGNSVIISQENKAKTERYTILIEVLGGWVKLSACHHTEDSVTNLLTCRRYRPDTLNKTLCGLLNKFEQRLGIDPLEALIASLEAL